MTARKFLVLVLLLLSVFVTAAYAEEGDKTGKTTIGFTKKIYTISYELNNGKLSDDHPVSFDVYSNPMTLKAPAKHGYTFDGWSEEGASRISKDVTIAKGSKENRKYIAHYTPITYSITYNMNSGSNDVSNPASYDIESSDITLAAPTRRGYDFNGWTYDNKTETAPTIKEGSTGNVEFTAEWLLHIYSINYSLNGGIVDQANPAAYDVTSEDFTLNNPTKRGYTFSGWTGEELAGRSMTATIPQGSVGDRTYTANYTPITYTITYNLNEGTNNSDNPETYTIESATINLGDAEKGAYDFTGWTMDGETITAIPKGSIGNKALVANFTPIDYAITYELDGGTNDEANPATYNIESETITLNAPTKEGYNFSGWTLNGSAVTEIPTGSSGDKTITANWGETVPEMSSSTYSFAAYKGQYSRLALSATGLNLKWSLNGTLPSGLDFSGEGSTAEISGTPEAGTSGTYSVRVIAANEGGAASADVVITVASDFAESGDTEVGEPQTVTTDSGASSTTTTTTFKNGAGNIILAADIAITTEAEELTAAVGEAFSTKVNVDVTLNVHDTDYDEYSYSMEILDLPDWLSAEGETSSSGALEGSYHHEFTLSGTPSAQQDAAKVTFVANVTLAGDEPALDAYGSKEVFARVSAVRISDDISPDVTPETSPDVTPETSQDVNPETNTPDSGSDTNTNPDSGSDTATPKEPVVIEEGKITLNNNTSTSGDSGSNIADIVANMTDEQKQSIKQLEINSEVKDFGWIKELTNIKELTVGEEAQIESFDLSGNTSIEEVKTDGANVKSMNLAGCTNLKELSCAGCGVENMDTTGCVSLTNAGVSGNSLLKFDAEGLPSLQSLDCGGQSATTETIGQEFSLEGGTASAASFMMSASVLKSASDYDKIKNLKAFDAEGNEIEAEIDKATGTMHFASAPAKITYDYDTGFNGVMMDVVLYASSAADSTDPANPADPDTPYTPDSGSGVSSNGGGCNAGWGMTAILAGLLVFLKKRR